MGRFVVMELFGQERNEGPELQILDGVDNVRVNETRETFQEAGRERSEFSGVIVSVTGRLGLERQKYSFRFSRDETPQAGVFYDACLKAALTGEACRLTVGAWRVSNRAWDGAFVAAAHVAMELPEPDAETPEAPVLAKRRGP